MNESTPRLEAATVPFSARAGVRTALLASACALLIALPSSAQTLGKRLGRNFDSNLYYPADSFFTAQGPEAVLALGHPTGVCFSGSSCSVDTDCVAPETCINGACGAVVDAQVGYVAVIAKARFCSILACGGVPVPECPGAVCDGSGTCNDPGSNVSDLCRCLTCDESDPPLPASDHAVADTFDGTGTASWALGQAEFVHDATRSYLFLRKGDFPPDPSGNPTFPPTSVALTRFPLTPGADYVIHVKWTFVPADANLRDCRSAQLTLWLDTGAPVCP